MKYIFSSFFILFFPQAVQAVSVRVLLDQCKRPQWSLASSKGFVVRSNKGGTKLFSEVKHLTVSTDKKQLYLNGQRVVDTLIIRSLHAEHISFENKYYEGFFIIAFHKKQYHLINVIDSEKYIFSVLKTESWPGWPLELNKAFAIASRSYLFYQMRQAKKQKLPYHIKNSNHHQTYAGTHNCPVLKQAVQETADIFLAHDGEPILAMFDICCGGVIPQKIDGVVDFNKAPYLARSYPCTFCKECKSYRWEHICDFKEFSALLQNEADNFVHRIKAIKIDTDAAGVVSSVRARTHKKEYTFTARQMYKLFKPIKSFVFSIRKKANKIIIKGKGFGHHFGLCQWGARYMVSKGWKFDDVLQFFYPNTTFTKAKR